jgi:hypothetical protein
VTSYNHCENDLGLLEGVSGAKKHFAPTTVRVSTLAQVSVPLST